MEDEEHGKSSGKAIGAYRRKEKIIGNGIKVYGSDLGTSGGNQQRGDLSAVSPGTGDQEYDSVQYFGKGYVENRQEGLHHIYTPLVTRLEYEQALICQELEKSFGSGSFEHLVAAFCGKEKLTKKQAERVQELLDAIKEEP